MFIDEHRCLFLDFFEMNSMINRKEGTIIHLNSIIILCGLENQRSFQVEMLSTNGHKANPTELFQAVTVSPRYNEDPVITNNISIPGSRITVKYVEMNLAITNPAITN